MHIREIGMAGFTCHKSTFVELPERGVVVVSGDNGSGKSSLPDAAAWAVWGKTLRGSNPIAPGAECAATVASDVAYVSRTRADGKNTRTSLTWHAPGETAAEWPTATKAAEALHSVVGSFDDWAQTSALSSDEAARFTRATDSERKRFLERVLGLERFDAAHAAARADRKAAVADVIDCGHRQREAEQRAVSAGKRADDAEAALAVLRPGAPPDEARVAALRRVVADYTADLRAAAARLDALRDAAASARERRRTAAAAVDLLSSGHCPTCGQGVGDDMVARLRDESDAAAEASRRAYEEAERARADVDADVAELRAERSTAEQRIAEITAAADQHAKHDAVAGRLRAQADAATVDRVEAEVAAVAVAGEAKQHGARAEELRVVEEVLGLRGVRAHLLGRALGAITATANGWLQRLGGGISVELRAQSTQASGAVVDEIDLHVTGAGGGRGYRAASSGERRRIDVALLLALAQTAAAARGVEPGTIFLDEVAEHLDADGVAGLADILADFAERRAVVLITHNAELAAQIPAVARWHVEAGEVTVR